MKLNSLYVSCTNLDRATNWYRQHLLNREPNNQTDRFIFWKLGEVYFGLFDANAVDEAIDYGNNCVPNFEVEDVDALHDRLKAAGESIIMPLNDVNGTRIFQCKDSEGNVLEFYQWIDKQG